MGAQEKMRAEICNWAGQPSCLPIRVVEAREGAVKAKIASHVIRLAKKNFENSVKKT